METGMTQGRWDVVIIGAGLMGLFTAYHLRQRGVKRVAVLDRGHAGGVASPRAGGLLRCHYNHPLLVEMAMRGDEAYASFAERYGGEAGLVRNGYVVCVGGHQAAALEKNVQMQQELGVDVVLLTPEQFKAEFTEFTGLGTATVAAYERSCAYANPPAVAASMVRACREVGVTVLEGYPVVGLETTNGRVSAVQTPGGIFVTDLVVNCAGAWAAKVGRMASIDVPVVAQRKLQIIEVQRPAQLSGHLRTLSHETMDFYARPSAATRVWIGSRVPFAATTDPDSIDLLVDEEKALRQRSVYQEVATFPLGEITSSWAGIDGDTPDFQPILGPAPGVNGLYLAVGFSGHGFKLAPVVGQLMAEHITAGRFLTMDVSSLGFERFAQGGLFEPGYKQMGA